jgi:signal peptidase I
MLRLENMDSLAPIIIESVNSGGSVKLTVTGNSMLPLLVNRRDAVVLEKAAGPLRKYDVPLYKRDNGGYILHRAVKIKKNNYAMAGDNETKLEYGVRQDQIIAVMSGFYRKGKYCSTKNPKYRAYAMLWCAALPYRQKIWRIYQKLKGKL